MLDVKGNSYRHGKMYGLNLKIIYVMRIIGKVPTAGNELCVLLDLPKPPQKFEKYTLFHYKQL